MVDPYPFITIYHGKKGKTRFTRIQHSCSQPEKVNPHLLLHFCEKEIHVGAEIMGNLWYLLSRVVHLSLHFQPYYSFTHHTYTNCIVENRTNLEYKYEINRIFT
ncbi:PREDICTED: uncharacterized protein LOC109361595 [Lupinus angustifolius]|uniref:uncharacterized protein LOC109361595 n=1 Tax=Lupinus angustifolius TaxID=3871 RepID=UPI00092E4881|nr:PREDICTED: uncharacterized protein LOC109361595 [Lupinus angustifolius]